MCMTSRCATSCSAKRVATRSSWSTGTDVAYRERPCHGVGRSRAHLVEGGQNVAIVGADIDGTGPARGRAGRRRSQGAAGLAPSHRRKPHSPGLTSRDDTVGRGASARYRTNCSRQLLSRIRRTWPSTSMATIISSKATGSAAICCDVNLTPGAIYAGRDWTFRGNVIRRQPGRGHFTRRSAR